MNMTHCKWRDASGKGGKVMEKEFSEVVDKLEKEMTKAFGAPDGSIVFLYAAHDPDKPQPNVWVVPHPLLYRDETFTRMAGEMAAYVREKIPREAWRDGE